MRMVEKALDGCFKAIEANKVGISVWTYWYVWSCVVSMSILIKTTNQNYAPKVTVSDCFLTVLCIANCIYMLQTLQPFYSSLSLLRVRLVYSADHTVEFGDNWNLEDLSVFSAAARTDLSNLDSGGRALKALVRPYPLYVLGSM